MKKNILEDIKLSIKGREVEAVLTGDNTREGGSEASHASEVIRQLFVDNDRYDLLTFSVVDRTNPRNSLWYYKLELHGNHDEYLLDLATGDFSTDVPVSE